MNFEEEIGIIRRAYAKQVMGWSAVSDARVEAAFAAVPREHFVGPGPWPIMRYGDYVRTPDADPVYVYDDVLIGLVQERYLNNGAPSYHAPLLVSAAIKEGEHVVHVGAGTGYYTAVMAYLVGAAGKVTELPSISRQPMSFTSTPAPRTRLNDGSTASRKAADSYSH
jgi:protein-L-isoaspartate(D-aspartate) O-methyltransferase